MTTNNNKGIEKSFHNPCPYGNDDCPKCSYPLTMEEKLDEKLQDYFKKDTTIGEHRYASDFLKEIAYPFIRSEISSAVTQALEEQRGEALEEIDIMLAEEPSNYPTPQGQEAVYGVLERLKERLLSNNK